MKTFKILGLLLTYPHEQWLVHLPELQKVLEEEGLLDRRQLQKVTRLMKTLTVSNNQESQDKLFELQENYVETFDRGRAHCLHLFEHVHGESRDRGQAMVDLNDLYATKKLYIDSNELPDYLPLFLEYLSLCDMEEATGLLGETIDILAAIGVKLKKRNSPYYVVFEALEQLSAIKPDRHRVVEAVEKAPRDPETLEELDEVWAEEPAFDGDPAACNSCNAFPNATAELQKINGGA